MTTALHLVRAWLLLDFFGDTTDRAASGSTLTTTIFGQAFLAFVFAALLYPDYSIGPFAAANLSLSTLLVAVGVLANQDRLQRVRADRLLVATAPVSRSALALARALHGAFYIVLITTGLALAPAILCYWLPTSSMSGAEAGGLGAIARYLAVAILLAGLATGLLSVIVGTAARSLGEARSQLLGASLRALFLFGGFLGFATLVPNLDEGAAALGIAPALVRSSPPYLGARWIADPAVGSLGLAALLGAAAILAIASIGLQSAAGDRRLRREVRPGWFDRLIPWFTRRGPSLGFARFVGTQLYRSPGFRSKVLPLFALPFAMVVLTMYRDRTGEDGKEDYLLLGIALQFPAIYLPILVAFLAEAEQEKARWLFATSPFGNHLATARHGSHIALLTHILLPIHGLTLTGLLLAGLDPRIAIGNVGFAFGVAILAARISLRRLDCAPFTDERAGVAVEFGDLMGAALVLGAIGAAFAAIAPPWPALALGGLAAVSACRWVRRATPALTVEGSHA